MLIIASMIEKEASRPSERPLIAAVIYNRLHARMPLGIDATIRYGLNIPGTKSLTKAAAASSEPVQHAPLPGLPPTPIANPGIASMQAAAHPAHVATSTSCASPTSAPLLHVRRERVPTQGLRVRLRLQSRGSAGATTLVGILG